ncbi:hypothetical protein L226DRAFT_574793 [Lentinus tigrinus ALCF2SS1-7]|uniref:uncharacterized protein n=1 Tax=Lentinus tigrinus ALCF2SS1-7 TaxID=1328758 RepID=UPI001165CD41|nr:hypothetical protein L226DRAFT_574793 [Lentinus tigrinus ALCF2SS1-7]
MSMPHSLSGAVNHGENSVAAEVFDNGSTPRQPLRCRPKLFLLPNTDVYGASGLVPIRDPKCRNCRLAVIECHGKSPNACEECQQYERACMDDFPGKLLTASRPPYAFPLTVPEEFWKDPPNESTRLIDALRYQQSSVINMEDANVGGFGYPLQEPAPFMAHYHSPVTSRSFGRTGPMTDESDVQNTLTGPGMPGQAHGAHDNRTERSGRTEAQLGFATMPTYSPTVGVGPNLIPYGFSESARDITPPYPTEFNVYDDWSESTGLPRSYGEQGLANMNRPGTSSGTMFVVDPVTGRMVLTYNTHATRPHRV